MAHLKGIPTCEQRSRNRTDGTPTTWPDPAPVATLCLGARLGALVSLASRPRVEVEQERMFVRGVGELRSALPTSCRDDQC
jgi:hypothetical protein